MYRTLYLLVFLQICYLRINAQENQDLDSLQTLLQEYSSMDLNKAKLLGDISQKYHEKELYPQAIFYKEQEAKIYQDLAIDSANAYCNERLGVMYYHIGSYNSSSTHLLQALSYFEEVEKNAMVAQISTNLANVFTRLENHQRAIAYLLKAETVFKNSTNASPRTLAGLYTNLGLAYSGNQQLDSAMLYYNKALELTNESENPLYIASILNNMGEVNYEREENEEALNRYEKSLALFTQIQNHNGMGATKSNIAKLKIRLGEYDKAIDLCDESLEHFRRINSLYFIVSTQEQLYRAYKGKGDFVTALESLELYQKLNDSLMGAETTEHIANLEMHYATQKEKQKFKLLEQEAELIEKELKLKQLYLYLSVSGIGVLLVIVILIVLNMRGSKKRNQLKEDILKKEQERLEDRLFYKQKEIENFANYIQEKNQLLENLKKEIKSISKKEEYDKSSLFNITNLVNQSLHVDNDRKELELKIDQNHQEFIYRLKSTYPKLTRTDIRLCSLLLLELSSKEIALIMNIEPNSVKTSRNRLRKKLELPANSDLVAFLNKLK